MAPHPLTFLKLLPRQSIVDGAAGAAKAVAKQFDNPSNVSSLLLIFAGDIVGAALEQLSGPSFVPVVFSFGWVSYAQKAFVNAVGSNKIMRDAAEAETKIEGWLIEVGSGRAIKNKSVLLNHIMGDAGWWMPQAMKDAVDDAEKNEAKHRHTPKPATGRPPGALRKFFTSSSTHSTGVNNSTSISTVEKTLPNTDHTTHPLTTKKTPILTTTEKSTSPSSTSPSTPSSIPTPDPILIPNSPVPTPGPDDEPDIFAALTKPFTITIFRTSTKHPPCICLHDLIWFNGILVALLQLGIASIPCGLYGDWTILTVTALGTTLALLTGMLPQFGAEKWGTKSSRANSTPKTIALTRGSPSTATEAIVIRAVESGIDLTDLAQGPTHSPTSNFGEAILTDRTVARTTSRTAWPWTRSATALLAIAWIALLLIVSGLQQNSWYLLGVGFIGMVQNGIVACTPRTPGARGLHLEFEERFTEANTGVALVKAEAYWESLGRSLLKNICPESSHVQRNLWWEEQGVALRGTRTNGTVVGFGGGEGDGMVGKGSGSEK